LGTSHLAASLDKEATKHLKRAKELEEAADRARSPESRKRLKEKAHSEREFYKVWSKMAHIADAK